MAVRKKVMWQILVVIVLLAAGAAALAAFALSKKPPSRKKAVIMSPMVRTIQVGSGPRQVVVHGEGTVTPLSQAILAAEVAGQAEFVSPKLVAGGAFKKGDLLLRIQQKDYELALTLAEAKVKAAETSLSTTKEEAAAAREEWRLLDQDDGKDRGEPPALLVKEPQLAQYQASLEAARAEVEQARVNLARTEIRAPFDGRVASESVDLGQYLSKGATVATVFSIEAVEINVYIEDRDLAWLLVPGLTSRGAEGSPAVVKADFAGQERSWQGRVVRALGRVNQSTRLVGVVVRVDRPYASLPPLAMGVFVKVALQGNTLPGASLIPRAALREGDVVWTVGPDGKLVFTKVKVARLQGSQALLDPGLPQGTEVVTTNLREVSDGMKVRLAGREG
ncbi:MAG: efflux RND transporter periplasmic adaptor subunit [Desulfarculaceae bacterium]|nr:efflux RND transporter periplasmic adaptor subunit [Desulfarculaceae bacterium]MCF8071736.1 efflux RND transporter periplasmic adaptor subunit [Desulfarculaceae bacterium]MCF8102417.1 efflux RND transporter periplasmic adaptor subunit [Desulfarculaceae bacterium]MCF8116759.1 efflux RND transporter periplasmic adaptor subunit [Desulfarculaceae bacterium]